MTDITPQSTLADIVTSCPELADELEQRGLNYCCGGRRTLAEASKESGLDADRVASDLATVASSVVPAAASPSWARLDAARLADHIEATHHRYLHDELPSLGGLIDTVTAVHGERHPELGEIQVTFRALRADLEPHLQREELVLFPAIRLLAAVRTAPVLPFGSVQRPISVMLVEHDTAGGLLARLHALSGGYRPPPGVCASYAECYARLAELEHDVHLHVYKENHVLFPAVVRLEHYLHESGES